MSAFLTADELLKSCAGKVMLMGLGNPLLGDDGFGVALASRLQAEGAQGVVVAGLRPESHLHRMHQADTVLLADAVDVALEPGSLVLMDAAAVRARFPQITTHRIALGTLAAFLGDEGRRPVFLLGVQPERVEPALGLSERVQAALEAATAMLRSCLVGNGSDRIPTGVQGAMA